MAEKINISNRETSFQGLWYNSIDHRYTSAVILGSSLTNLKGCFRIVMYKNRFHKGNDNRPNYNLKFCGLDADDASAKPRNTWWLDIGKNCPKGCCPVWAFCKVRRADDG